MGRHNCYPTCPVLLAVRAHGLYVNIDDLVTCVSLASRWRNRRRSQLELPAPPPLGGPSRTLSVLTVLPRGVVRTLYNTGFSTFPQLRLGNRSLPQTSHKLRLSGAEDGRSWTRHPLDLLSTGSASVSRGYPKAKHICAPT